MHAGVSSIVQSFVMGYAAEPDVTVDPDMNFYFEAAKILDKLDKKHGSIKGVLSSVPEKDRKRTSALVIESLKCTFNFVAG